MDVQTDPQVLERLEQVCSSDVTAAPTDRQRLTRASRPSARALDAMRRIPGI